MTDCQIIHNNCQLLAEQIFTNKNTTFQITTDQNMDIADLFCMLTEIILYGIQILSNNQYEIFDLQSSSDDFVKLLQKYFSTLNLKFNILQLHITDPYKYHYEPTYYIHIVPKPPSYLLKNQWNVLNYRLIHNKLFTYNKYSKLSDFKFFFINNQNIIFIVNFDY